MAALAGNAGQLGLVTTQTRWCGLLHPTSLHQPCTLLGALTLDKMQPGALGTYSTSGAKLCKGGRCWFGSSGPQRAFGTWGRPLAKPPPSLPLEGAQLGHALQTHLHVVLSTTRHSC